MTAPDLPDPPRETDRPDELVALLARLDAHPAPASVRDGVLRAAAGSPRRGVSPLPSLDVFEHCVRDVEDALRLVGADALDRPVDAYGWTVAELVQHLAAVERHMMSVLGIAPDDHDPDRLDHLAVGRELRARLATGRPDDAVRTWRDAAQATIAGLRDGSGPALDATVQMHQWPLSVDGLLIVRSFELWTHADDLRRAVGRELVAPPAAALRAMSARSVEALPLLAAVVTPRGEMPGARVVLTGAGGGTHDIGTGDRVVTLVADVVDYCRLVARRAGDSVVEVEGDRAVAADLVAAAQAIAM